MKNDKVTTFLGALLGAGVWAQIDLPKLLAADHTEIAKLISGVTIALLGYFTNKVA
jgi:hypothetical protein